MVGFQSFFFDWSALRLLGGKSAAAGPGGSCGRGSCRFRHRATLNPLLLTSEILHHLGCMKPYKEWDKLPINRCRISAINSMNSFDFGPGKLETKKLMMPWAEGSQFCSQCSRCGAVFWHCLLEAGKINGSGKCVFFSQIYK